MSQPNIIRQVWLLDRTKQLRSQALVTQGNVVGGDLTPWYFRLQYKNEGIDNVNSAILVMTIDAFGTFIRDASSPNLFDQNAKNKYLIEFTITQNIAGTSYNSKTFRGQLGEATTLETPDEGELIQIPLNDLLYITTETPISSQDLFITPNLRFQRITDYYVDSIGPSPPAVMISSANSLPNDSSLKQSWTPFEPTMVHDLWNEVITQVSLPSPLGGTFTDFYYDDDPDPTFNLQVNVTASVFGGINSGVIIEPLPAAGTQAGGKNEETAITDNTRYKNQAILIASATGGSLPMDHTRFASYYSHCAGFGLFTGRDEWSASGAYTNGSSNSPVSVVKRTFPGASDPNQRQRFFLCIQNIGPTALPPESDPIHWKEDFSTNPGASGFIDPSPWTSPLEDYLTNMAGLGNVNIGSNIGYFWDWNIERAIYDTNTRTVPSNNYATLSVKWVFMVTNTPPSNEYYFDQNRYLIGPNPTGAWTGYAGRVAQLDMSTNPIGVWQISNAPTTGDTVNDMNTGTVLQYQASIPAWVSGNAYNTNQYVTYSGTVYLCTTTIAHSLTAPPSDPSHWIANPFGNWVIVWGIPQNTNGSTVNYDRGGSPFHAVSNFKNITGPSGIPNRAIQATYTWSDPSARGAWLSFMFPYPRITTTNGSVGHLYGGTGVFGTAPFLTSLDCNNLNFNSHGIDGWNNGPASEDMGQISAICFKLNVSMYSAATEAITSLITGLANIPMILWALDNFGRIYYQDFQLSRNGAWDNIVIPFGYSAPQQLYFSRIDELALLLGYTFPWDGYIREKEFSGVYFDWKYVKAWGIMMAAPYLEKSGFYIGGQQSGLDQITQTLQQGASNLFFNWPQEIANLLNPNYTPTTANQFVHHVNIAIDELYFQKQLIVNSAQTPLGYARATVEHYETETDYLNALSRSQAIATRNAFYPQFTHLRSLGDVRAKFGQNITLAGPRVPNGPLTMVIKSVNHIWDHDSYNMELLTVRRFTTSG